MQSQIPPIENENGTINKELAAEALPLLPSFPSPFTDLRSLHPNPEHVLKLWQIFAEKIHPLTKVIHAPTLQQRILEVAWNLDKLTPSLEAVMFGVYTLAVSCMRPSDSLREFGEPGSVLLSRYRRASAQALTAANLCSTKDFEVLQAFMLYLVCSLLGVALVTAIALTKKSCFRFSNPDPRKQVQQFEKAMTDSYANRGLPKIVTKTIRAPLVITTRTKMINYPTSYIGFASGYPTHTHTTIIQTHQSTLDTNQRKNMFFGSNREKVPATLSEEEWNKFVEKIARVVEKSTGRCSSVGLVRRKVRLQFFHNIYIYIKSNKC